MDTAPHSDPASVGHEAIRATIRERVSAGIKGVELACEVAASHPRSGDAVLDVIKLMVAGGEIVEVEYVTPENEGDDAARVKSFYLPAGSRVRLASGSIA